MTFSMPTVRNQYVMKEIDVIFNIMAYRRLTEAEVLTAVAQYRRAVGQWPPAKGSRVTIPCLLGQR